MYRKSDHQFSAQGGFTATSNITLLMGPGASFVIIVISAKYSTAKAGVSLKVVTDGKGCNDANYYFIQKP